MTPQPVAQQVLQEIWTALHGPGTPTVAFTGQGSLPSAFAVSDLAAGAIAATAAATAELVGSTAITVDRRLASLWFGWSFRPDGWTAPAPWDPIAGDYEAADGWIRLHTNAPHHRAAALSVLATAPDRDAVAHAVRRHPADTLESLIVAAGGAAAAMRPLAAWAAHPQGRAVAAEPLAWCERTPGPPPPTNPAPPNRPLAGIRVLDLTRVFAGPVCTRILAGLGAEVLRIDPPDWDEPGVVPEMTLGKRCARLNARTPEGQAHLQTLLASADILVHGYRPGAMHSIGLAPTQRTQIRPGLIDISLDAYGHTGPWSPRRGFDSLLQMSSGIADEGMRRFGTPHPTPLPVQALDHAAGYIMAAAALRGLSERQTGNAWRVRTSLARVATLLTPTARQPPRHTRPTHRRRLHRPPRSLGPPPPPPPPHVRPRPPPLGPPSHPTRQRSQAGSPTVTKPSPAGGTSPKPPALGPPPRQSTRRLRPPMSVPGAPLHWDHPPTPTRQLSRTRQAGSWMPSHVTPGGKSPLPLAGAGLGEGGTQPERRTAAVAESKGHRPRTQPTWRSACRRPWCSTLTSTRGRRCHARSGAWRMRNLDSPHASKGAATKCERAYEVVVRQNRVCDDRREWTARNGRPSGRSTSGAAPDEGPADAAPGCQMSARPRAAKPSPAGGRGLGEGGPQPAAPSPTNTRTHHAQAHPTPVRVHPASPQIRIG